MKVSKPVRSFSLEEVTVAFGRTRALDGITLRVEPGERVAVIGPSGAGKSTLLRTLTRSVALDEGKVTVGGRDLYALPPRELKSVRRGIGTIYQAYNLIPQLPVGVNAALGEVGSMGALYTLRTLVVGPAGDHAARVRDALGRLGLAELANERTANISGGQQQRVAVARLLVQQPGLILADEPFAAVDPVTTDRVLQALIELNHEGATLLANLHDVELARRFPRVVALRNGRVVFDGPPERLTERQLSGIYAGDRPGGSERAPERSPEHSPPGPAGPVRVAEGRDGNAAH